MKLISHDARVHHRNLHFKLKNRIFTMRPSMDGRPSFSYSEVVRAAVVTKKFCSCHFKTVPTEWTVMFRQPAAVLAICVTAWATPNISVARSLQPHTEQSDEQAIRSERAVLNDALRARDVKVFADSWLKDAHVTGYGGALLAGREQLIAAFSKDFSGESFISGLRTPVKIEVASGGPLEAAESGVFEWAREDSGALVIDRGRYLIMWKKVDGLWKIQSELYVQTSSCTGQLVCFF